MSRAATTAPATAAWSLPVALPHDFLILGGEHVGDEASPDTDSQVDGVMASRGEQPNALRQIKSVKDPCHLLPSNPPHVQRGNHCSGNMAGEKEEEGDIANWEVCA